VVFLPLEAADTFGFGVTDRGIDYLLPGIGSPGGGGWSRFAMRRPVTGSPGRYKIELHETARIFGFVKERWLRSINTQQKLPFDTVIPSQLQIAEIVEEKKI
jgi:hypothetical protein